jgi:hypothetical protein
MWRPLSVTTNLRYGSFLFLFPIITKNTIQLFVILEKKMFQWNMWILSLFCGDPGRTELNQTLEIFWDTTCSRVKTNRRFEGKCRVHLQGWRLSQARNQHEAGSACCLLHSGFFVGLLFDPEDWGGMFIRNVGWLSTEYTASYPRRWYSS